jgi:RNA polymerase sigma factor (sigma-70 family)
MLIRRRHGVVASARRWLRAALRRKGGPGTEAGAPPAATADREADVRIDRQMRLLDAVTGVPEPYRTALFHCRFDGMEPEEVARRLRIPAETVEAWLHHALRLLAERLERDHAA